MKRAPIDSLLVVAIGAAIVCCFQCILVGWAWVFDSSGASALMALAGSLLAAAVGLAVPGRIVRILRLAAPWRNSARAALVEWAICGRGGPARIGQKDKSRLLAASAALAVATAAVSASMVLASPMFIDLMLRRFLWTPLSWEVLRFLVVFAATIPFGSGAGIFFLAAGRLAGGSARDPYAGYWRRWLWSVAIGMGAFAMLLATGLSVIAIAAVAAVSTGAIIGQMLSHRLPAARAPRPPEAYADSLVRRQAAIVIGHAAFAAAIVLQCRLLVDVAGASSTATALWMAVTVGLFAHFLSRTDATGRPSARFVYASMSAVAVGLTMQLAMASAALGGGVSALVAGGLAAAAQVPLAALAAVVFSAHRRAFATDGQPVGRYAIAALVGASGGLLSVVVVGRLGVGGPVLPVLLMAMFARGLLGQLQGVRSKKGRKLWARRLAIAACVMFAAIFAQLHVTAARRGRIASGLWLSREASRLKSGRRSGGYLPVRDVFRSGAITAAVRQVLADIRHQGRWLFVTPAAGNLPESLPRSVRPVLAFADPAAAPGGRSARGKWSVCDADFLRASRVEANDEPFDGIFLAPLPADHGQAWRCYNLTSLRRVAARAHKGSPVLLRAQVRRDNADAALAVAMTFKAAVGSGFMLIDAANGDLDMLLVGPGETIATVGAHPLAALDLAHLGSRLAADPIQVTSPLPRVGRITSWDLLACARRRGP